MSVTVTGSVRSHRSSPPQHGHCVIVTGTSTGGASVAAPAGDFRKVNWPCPALRPGRFRRFLRFPGLVAEWWYRPAAFNSSRSCSFSLRRRSFSFWDCSSCRRRSLTSASRSFNRFRRSSCMEPSIALYRATRSSECPAFSANQLPDSHRSYPPGSPRWKVYSGRKTSLKRFEHSSYPRI